MVKVVAMFNLPRERMRRSSKSTSSTSMPRRMRRKYRGLRRYVIGKVAVPAGQPAWYRINELWFDSVQAASKAFNSKEAVDCTND